MSEAIMGALTWLITFLLAPLLMFIFLPADFVQMIRSFINVYPFYSFMFNAIMSLAFSVLTRQLLQIATEKYHLSR